MLQRCHCLLDKRAESQTVARWGGGVMSHLTPPSDERYVCVCVCVCVCVLFLTRSKKCVDERGTPTYE